MAEKLNLVKKLSDVMRQVKYIQKRGLNKFHNYKYATEADVAEKVRDVLAEHSVIMMPSVTHREFREITTRKGNTEFICTVDMDFVFYDGDSGETITIKAAGEGQDAGDKAIYKAITGAQKYALMKAFMIPTGDDPESDREHENGKSNGEDSDKLAQLKSGYVAMTKKLSKAGYDAKDIKGIITHAISKDKPKTPEDVSNATAFMQKVLDQKEAWPPVKTGGAK